MVKVVGGTPTVGAVRIQEPGDAGTNADGSEKKLLASVNRPGCVGAR